VDEREESPLQLVVIAKEPKPGRVKTRLCPPCTPEQAAAIAEAGLADTLQAVAATPASRYVLALDGCPGSWMPPGFDVIRQRGDGLDERLTAAFADCFAAAPDESIVLVGMDTPQLTPEHLTRAAAMLATSATPAPAPDAVLGPAVDGGYWLIGLRHLAEGAIAGVPMSRDDTYARQIDRLETCGYRVAVTDELVDVDTAAEARLVAGQIPSSRFAAAVGSVFTRSSSQ
jgi:rSAM/selenodomain-associated transferase 1